MICYEARLLLGFFSSVYVGTLGIFATYIYHYGVDPFTMVFWRVLLSLILLGTYIVLFLHEIPFTRNKLCFYFFYGFVGVFIFYTLYFYTVKISSVSFVVLLVYTAPAFSVLLGRIILGEPVTKEKGIALLVVLVGVVLVVGNVELKFTKLAILTGICTGFVYALYGVLGKFGVRNEKPEKVLFMTLLFGLLFLAPFSKFSVPREALPYLIGLSFFPTFLGYTLYFHALKKVEVSRASIIAIIEPVVALILAYLLFGEELSFIQLVGGGCIICGSILVHLKNSGGD